MAADCGAHGVHRGDAGQRAQVQPGPREISSQLRGAGPCTRNGRFTSGIFHLILSGLGRCGALAPRKVNCRARGSSLTISRGDHPSFGWALTPAVRVLEREEEGDVRNGARLEWCGRRARNARSLQNPVRTRKGSPRRLRGA
uniref:Uncharacterized protein n=1 Tax=Molossus molossus TaxID=27622 RepID=A0A7J8DTN7_MOLMO|nr:hypothetical protein HJG59_009181 [Molossus molossus]